MNNPMLWKIILNLAFALLIIVNGYVYFIVENKLSVLAAFFILTIKLAPLLAFYPFVIKPNYKASLFFCLLLMGYFIFISMSMFQDGIRGYIAMLEGLILCLLFSAGFALGKSHKAV